MVFSKEYDDIFRRVLDGCGRDGICSSSWTLDTSIRGCKRCYAGMMEVGWRFVYMSDIHVGWTYDAGHDSRIRAADLQEDDGRYPVAKKLR